VRAPAFVFIGMALVHLSERRRFDPATGEVWVGDRLTRLEPQPAALLALLVERPGVLVSREEIRQRLWADGRHVDATAGLHYAVRQVRLALAGDGDDIETLPRRGYRLRREAVAPGPDAGPIAGRDGASEVRPTRRRPAVTLWALAAAMSVAVVVIVERRPNDHHQRVVAFLGAVHDIFY
jgi:DNA-binding winged helix-turn-helix (wHTH) protein